MTRSLPPPLLRMQGIDKAFPGIQALSGVDLRLHAGEVLALVGENGAGKSTLIKILAGAQAPDQGSIEIDGQPLPMTGPLIARRAGVSVIYQEFNLVPAMTARENIFLGRERSRIGFLPAKHEHRRAWELFGRVGVRFDPETLCRNLTVAQQQVVEIAKALVFESRIIVMDEPTSALSPKEVQGLFAVIRELKAQGMGIVYVSHRLAEVFQVADRVTVLRDGQHIASQPIGELTRERLIELMVGRALESEFPKRDTTGGGTRTIPAEPRLVVQGLRGGSRVNGVSFEVRRGEVLALTGLAGAGRTETVRLIFGADKRDAGSISLDGRPLKIRRPREAISAGICLLTEDRKTQGLVLGLSAQQNFGLPNTAHFGRFGFLNVRRESIAFDGFVEKLQIKLAGRDQQAVTLSGGNQQKIVLAKWLEQNAEIIMFDEPTRGIDVGTKYEIYLLIHRLAAQGKGVVMISSELPEVLGMADRILVMHDGRVTGEITDVANATQEQIMDLAVK